MCRSVQKYLSIFKKVSFWKDTTWIWGIRRPDVLRIGDSSFHLKKDKCLTLLRWMSSVVVHIVTTRWRQFLTWLKEGQPGDAYKCTICWHYIPVPCALRILFAVNSTDGPWQINHGRRLWVAFIDLCQLPIYQLWQIILERIRTFHT